MAQASSGEMGKLQMHSGETPVENGSCTVFSWPAVMALSWPWNHKNEAAPLSMLPQKDGEDC